MLLTLKSSDRKCVNGQIEVGNFVRPLKLRLIDFRLKIILLVGTPNYKGNNYCIIIKVKIKVSSNSSRNISKAPRLYSKYLYSG